MFQNYLNVAIRNLIKYRLYSLINVLGLAVGLAACVLITQFVRDEMSFDKHWEKADRIVRLQTRFNIPGREPLQAVTSMGIAKPFVENYFATDVEKVTRFQPIEAVLKIDGRSHTDAVMFTDSETADIFDLPVLHGDLKATLADKSSIALSEEAAIRYFGRTAIVDEIITLTALDIKRDYRVGAVFADLPHNTVLEFEILTKIDEADFENQPWLFNNWFSINAHMYIELKPESSLEKMASRLDAFANETIAIPAALGGDRPSSEFIVFSLMSIGDVQLNPIGIGEMKPTGDKTMVALFLTIAALILLIACINFMNLATAKSTQRAREVALRKVMGARRSQLIFQFLGESVLVALIGLLLGLVLVELFLPVYGNFLNRELAFSYGDPVNLLTMIGLVLVVGVIGGAYPAVVLSRYVPAAVLKANKSTESSGSTMLRSGLVVFQFAISIALIVATTIVYAQMNFIQNMDLGYNKEKLLVINGTARQGIAEQQVALKAELERLPGVELSSYTQDAPLGLNESNISMEVPGSVSNEPLLIGVQTVDFDFLNTMQIPLIAGRDYDRQYERDTSPNREGSSPEDVMESNLIINEAAAARFGFASAEDAIGKKVRQSGGDQVASIDYTIIGVIPDINYQSVQSEIRPEVFINDPQNFLTMVLRYSGDTEAVIEQTRAVWEGMAPDVPFQYSLIDEVLEQQLANEKNTANMLAVFSLLAVAVACLGLFGLASFTAERRTKEIGIRKVMGAGVVDIVRLLIWQFSKPVLLANLLAWPVAIYALNDWLQTFPYRVDSLWLLPSCLVAGLIAMSIAWLTVGGNAARVARANPVKALRYE